MDPKHLTFVDDDRQEIETFLALYSAPRFDITAVCVRSAESALREIQKALGPRVPDLFVLDMFLPQTDDAPDHLSAQQADQARADLDQLVHAISRLEKFFSKGKGLLRETHAVVTQAEHLLRRWCHALDQSPDGGIAVLNALRNVYPNTPKIFYSRKFTFEDAERARREGALTVLRKPPAHLAPSKADDIANAFYNHCQT